MFVFSIRILIKYVKVHFFKMLKSFMMTNALHLLHLETCCSMRWIFNTVDECYTRWGKKYASYLTNAILQVEVKKASYLMDKISWVHINHSLNSLLVSINLRTKVLIAGVDGLAAGRLDGKVFVFSLFFFLLA